MASTGLYGSLRALQALGVSQPIWAPAGLYGLYGVYGYVLRPRWLPQLSAALYGPYGQVLPSIPFTA